MPIADTNATDRAPAGGAATAIPFTVKPLGRFMAAEIVGLDLSQPFDDAVRDGIRDALNTHKVLAFRGQDLDEEAQVAFTSRFGELEGHVGRDWGKKKFGAVHLVSNLDPDGKPTTDLRSNGNYFWHTDKSYHDIPSYSTILHALTLPPDGGNTQFADMVRAYDALPDTVKEQIAERHVVHSWEASKANTWNRPASPEEIKEKPPVTHPMVRTHPDTGDKVLYIGKHASHIDGMDRGEGRALLYQLLDFATRPQFVYTHAWKTGDVVMWDNRQLLHRACGDYDMATYPRILHRTVIRGTKPY